MQFIIYSVNIAYADDVLLSHSKNLLENYKIPDGGMNVNSFVNGREVSVHVNDNMSDTSVCVAGTAIVIGGAVAASLLALAVASGNEFLNHTTMDTYTRKLLECEEGVSVSKKISNELKKAGKGVVEFGSSVIGSFNDALMKMNMDTLDLGYLSVKTVDGLKFNVPVLPDGWYSDKGAVNMMKKIISDAPSETSFMAYSGETSETDLLDFGKQKIKLRCDGYTVAYKYVGSSGYWTTCRYETKFENKACSKTILIAVRDSKGIDRFLACSLIYNPGQALSSGTIDWLANRKTSELSEEMAWIGEVATGSNVLNKPDVGTDVTIKPKYKADLQGKSSVKVNIPSDTNELVNKKATDVSADSPTYKVWSPGETIAPPKVDNPSVSYTPDLSVPGTKPDSKPDTGTPSIPDVDASMPKYDFPTLPTAERKEFKFGELDFTPLVKNFDNLTNRFPFSLPFDFKRVIGQVVGKSRQMARSRSGGAAPVFVIPMPQGLSMTLDLSIFNKLAGLGRFFVGIGFSIWLILITKKVMP